MQTLRFVVEENIEMARMNMEPDYSMRSSAVNMQMNNMANQNFNNESSVYFEEVKANSISSKRCDFERITTEQATDVRNLVNFNNQGCGTNIQTVEKQLSARPDTKDMSSQSYRAQTVSQASQKFNEGVEQEINCQILKPELEEEQIIDNENVILCFRCDGT